MREKKTGPYDKAEMLVMDDVTQWLVKHRGHNHSSAERTAMDIIEALRDMGEDFDTTWREWAEAPKRVYQRQQRRNAHYHWKDFRNRYDYNYLLPQLGHVRFLEALKKKPGRRSRYVLEADREREKWEKEQQNS